MMAKKMHVRESARWTTSLIHGDGPGSDPPSGPVYQFKQRGAHIMSAWGDISIQGLCTGRTDSMSFFHSLCCDEEKISSIF